MPPRPQSLLISATQCLCLLILTSLLALAAPLVFDIKNLHLLNGTMDEIMNIHPEPVQPGKYSCVIERGKQGHVWLDAMQLYAPTQPNSSPVSWRMDSTLLCVWTMPTQFALSCWDKSYPRVL